MTTATRTNEGFRLYIPIALALVSVAVAWGVFSQRVETVQADVTDLKVHVQKIDDNYNTITNKLTAIQTTLELRLPKH